MMPVDAALAVTYRCNARCAMCGIWKSEPGPELPPDVFRRLPSSLRDVNLTGGEPFLRRDLPAVHEAVRSACPSSRTVISTNGLLTDRIAESVQQMARAEPGLGVAVSIDGPAPVHDRIRGIPGAYDKAMRSVKSLQDAGFANLRLAFTATRSNAQHLWEVYSLAQSMGVQFTCAIEHASEHYFQSPEAAAPVPLDALRGPLERVMESELRSLSPKRWARAYFLLGMWHYARGRGRLHPCRAGRDFFFMDPAGDVYTCNAAPFRMGNLAETDFDALWHSPEADAARKRVIACQQPCWMVCTARTAIRRAWPQVLAWALWRRLTGVTLPECQP